MCQSYLMMDVLFGERRCTACVSELPDDGCVVW